MSTVTARASHKPYKGLPMEGPIARWYARTTADGREYRRTARAIADRLEPDSTVLEVAPGPGYLAIELARAGSFRVTGLDISRSFVEMARENARRAGVEVDFRHGNASQLPFADGSFDFVVCRAAFKNFTDPVGALNETHRVLKPGGRASIFDLRKDAPLDAIDAAVDDMKLSAVSAFMTRWTFRHLLLKSAYSQDALRAMVAESEFRGCEIVEDGIGLELRLERVLGA